MVYEIQTIIRLMIETWMIVLWMIVSYPSCEIVQVHPSVRQQKSNNFTVAEVCSTVEWCAAPSVTGVHFQSPVS